MNTIAVARTDAGIASIERTVGATVVATAVGTTRATVRTVMRPTTRLTVPPSVRRFVTAVRSRLAPTADGLADVPGTKIKTRWLLAGWAALSAVSAIGTAITPALIHFPLLMMAFTPRLPILVYAVKSHVSPLGFFAIAVPRMLIGDPIHLLLGRRYGSRFVPAKARRLMVKLGVVGVVLRPTGNVLSAAGAVGMTTRRVMTADLVGTLALLLTIYTGTRTIFG